MRRLLALALVAAVLGGCDDGGAAAQDVGRVMDVGAAREVGPTDGGVERDVAVRDVGRPAPADAARDARSAADGPVPDAARDVSPPVDGPAPDGAPVVDGGVVDGSVADAGVGRDGAVDDAGAVVDARVVDAQVADAGVDARQLDLGADAGPGCEPIVLVPPPVSVDGEEVCNYVDDDGDGAVDEGFEYEFLYRDMRLTGDIGVWYDPHVVWSGRRFGMAWIGGRAGFVTSGPGLCDPSPVVELRGDGALPAQVRVAAAGGAFAAVFHTVQPPQAFLQLFSEDGVALGPPTRVGPRQGNARFFIDITAVGDAFAVFAETVDGRGVYQLVAVDGRILHGPMPIIPANHPAGFYNGMGLAYDGETIAFAWTGILNGSSQVTFMTWRPDGRIVIPPTVVHRGVVRTGKIVGLAVIGRTFLILHQWWNGEAEAAWAALVNVESGEPEVTVVELGRRRNVFPDFAMATSGQFIIEGSLDSEPSIGQVRMAPDGRIVSRTRSRAFSSAAAIGEGPFATWAGFPVGVNGLAIGLVYFGCGVQQ